MANFVILKGRTTKDIELKYSQNNVAMANFSLAVNRRYVKEGEERQTDFINCQIFGKTAKTFSTYVKKGNEVMIQGRIQTRNYDDKDGKKVYVTEVIVENFEFCGSKQSNTNDGEEPNVNQAELDVNVKDEDFKLPF